MTEMLQIEKEWKTDNALKSWYSHFMTVWETLDFKRWGKFSQLALFKSHSERNLERGVSCCKMVRGPVGCMYNGAHTLRDYVYERVEFTRNEMMF